MDNSNGKNDILYYIIYYIDMVYIGISQWSGMVQYMITASYIIMAYGNNWQQIGQW